jgi:hypothetical protein
MWKWKKHQRKIPRTTSYTVISAHRLFWWTKKYWFHIKWTLPANIKCPELAQEHTFEKDRNEILFVILNCSVPTVKTVYVRVRYRKITNRSHERWRKGITTMQSPGVSDKTKRQYAPFEIRTAYKRIQIRRVTDTPTCSDQRTGSSWSLN